MRRSREFREEIETWEYVLNVAQLFLGDFCHAKNVDPVNILKMFPKGQVP